ncbi:MAG: phosphopantetheine-binding protein [Bacteroidales bacterium]|nr:phosphopantetheine-binding protein [Bacteroidales bacterium]
MEKNEMQKKLIEMLAEEFEVEATDIKPEDPLMETLGLDSLDMIDVAVLIEKNFGVVLVQEDFKNLVSFEDFYGVIEKKVNAK